jgi:hypothetical protein
MPFRTCKTLCAFALVVVSAFAFGVSAVRAQEENLPAIERCRLLCERVYGQTGGDYEECAVACTEADGCHQDCKAKFGGDVGKVRQCLRTCMRRNDPKRGAVEKPIEL